MTEVPIKIRFSKCLVDACENPITTWGQLVQILIDRECETP